MTSILNFIKIYQLVQKLLGGTHRQTDRQTGDLISFTFRFKERRLKICKCSTFRNAVQCSSTRAYVIIVAVILAQGDVFVSFAVRPAKVIGLYFGNNTMIFLKPNFPLLQEHTFYILIF
jgi:hypothetical protein